MWLKYYPPWVSIEQTIQQMFIDDAIRNQNTFHVKGVVEKNCFQVKSFFRTNHVVPTECDFFPMPYIRGYQEK